MKSIIQLTEFRRKIIVFIDDLDRLTGDELVDVLKLIRNTANFRTLFLLLHMTTIMCSIQLEKGK
ncbi:MAG: hypothetical protein IPM91_08740 [Bacteroidetes bacterium]|nr:hypothetical protein [Bacteroidota bacterium]